MPNMIKLNCKNCDHFQSKEGNVYTKGRSGYCRLHDPEHNNRIDFFKAHTSFCMEHTKLIDGIEEDDTKIIKIYQYESMRILCDICKKNNPYSSYDYDISDYHKKNTPIPKEYICPVCGSVCNKISVYGDWKYIDY